MAPIFSPAAGYIVLNRSRDNSKKRKKKTRFLEGLDICFGSGGK